MKPDVTVSHSAEETEQAGEALCRALLASGTRHAYVAMYGEMGVGKTAFARGFGRALGITSVKSPTYTVVSEHRGEPLPLFHFDFYRLTDEDDLYTVGYDDYLRREGYILTEWSERMPAVIPPDAVTVRLERTEAENVRKITIGGETLEYTGS